MKRSQAGTRIECPSCSASLTVPETLATESMFDDLFDGPSSEPATAPASDSATLDSPSPDPAESFAAILEPASEDSEQEDSATAAREPLEAKATGEANQPVASTAKDQPKPDAVAKLEAFDPLAEVAEVDQPADDALEELGQEPGGDDPFEYNENKPLRVDGISPIVVDNDSFFMKCPVCDSDLQTNKREIGNNVVCTDCHSEITIAEPEKKKRRTDEWRKAATVKTTSDSDDGFKLEAPVQRPQTEMPVGADVGLDSVAGDLLTPRAPEEDDSALDGSDTKSPTQRRPKPSRLKPIDQANQTETPTGNQKRNVSPTTGAASTKPIASPRKRKAASQVGGEDLPPTLNQISKLDLLGDVDLMIRTCVAIVFLTFSYAMFDSVWKTLGMTELPGGERFVRYFPAAIGGFVCFAVVVWFMSITMSVLMRSVANGDKKVREWVGFAPSEWLGSFIAFAFAAWAASLPGGLMGYVSMKLTGAFFLLPLGLAISTFTIFPLFFMSSFYNESAFNIFAPDILQTISATSKTWKLAYISYAILLAGCAIGILILFIPGLLFCLLGAAIQVVVLSAFAVMIGLHANAIIKTIA